MPKEIERIKELIGKNLNVLTDVYHVRKLGVFGSTARGEATKASDIDVVVEFLEPVGFFLFLELEDFLGKILGRKVDLTTRNALKPTIRKEVLEETVYV